MTPYSSAGVICISVGSKIQIWFEKMLFTHCLESQKLHSSCWAYGASTHCKGNSPFWSLRDLAYSLKNFRPGGKNQISLIYAAWRKGPTVFSAVLQIVLTYIHNRAVFTYFTTVVNHAFPKAMILWCFTNFLLLPEAERIVPRMNSWPDPSSSHMPTCS